MHIDCFAAWLPLYLVYDPPINLSMQRCMNVSREPVETNRNQGLAIGSAPTLFLWVDGDGVLCPEPEVVDVGIVDYIPQEFGVAAL